ncbi:MAG: hypothetical protein COB67_03700 [SAR324 cluster bacterium]|uniref:Type II secretion system protein K n=1 Tax=SAR324 cluster bacterium TaxID=2024889 RepID=A0A2A4T7G0_9DELT|nr:MAG: hypothetical protein COB67_03700 [SAR324 cluster bacterium]
MHENKRGVALLMTLSVILLLSIALMKTFESRTVEVKHLENNLNYFRAVTLSRSSFRLLLTFIQETGVYSLSQYAKQFQGMPIPLEDLGEDITISNLKVESLDHRFYLNQRLESGKERAIALQSLIEHIKTKESEGAAFYLSDEQVPNFMSAVNDWVDFDSELDRKIDYGSGGEDYSEASPSFNVKNREFEYLSEVKLLPSFQQLELTNQQLLTYFRVFKRSTEPQESIDINLASTQEIIDFLAIYEALSPRIYNNRQEIAARAKEQDTAGSQYSLEAKYEGDIITYRNNAWDPKLEGIIGPNLTSKERELFSFRTSLLSIQYDFYAGRTGIRVQATLELSYTKDNKKNQLKSIKILRYSVN